MTPFLVWTLTRVIAPPVISTEWMTVAGLIAAIALGKVYDSRFAHPRIKKERNEELDTRLNNIRQAIKSSTDLIQQDVTTLSSDVRVVKGTMDVVADDVKGLKDRELARLESDAKDTRRRRR